MVDLTARLADGWNWFSDASGSAEHLRPIISNLDEACRRHGRQPIRSIDMYSFDPLGLLDDSPAGVATGSAEQMAGPIVGMRHLGVEEVRIDVYADPPRLAEATLAMSEVVRLVHSA